MDASKIAEILLKYPTAKVKVYEGSYRGSDNDPYSKTGMIRDWSYHENTNELYFYTWQ